MVFIAKSLVNQKIVYYYVEKHEKDWYMTLLDEMAMVVSARDSEKKTLFIKNSTPDEIPRLENEISMILRYGLYSECFFYDSFTMKDYRDMGGITALRRANKITTHKCNDIPSSLWVSFSKSERHAKTEIKQSTSGPRLTIVFDHELPKDSDVVIVPNSDKGPVSGSVFNSGCLAVPKSIPINNPICFNVPKSTPINNKFASSLQKSIPINGPLVFNDPESAPINNKLTSNLPKSIPINGPLISNFTKSPFINNRLVFNVSKSTPINNQLTSNFQKSVNISNINYGEDNIPEKNDGGNNEKTATKRSAPPAYYPNKKSRIDAGVEIPPVIEKLETVETTVNNFLQKIKLPGSKTRNRRNMKFSGRDIIRNLLVNLDNLKNQLGSASKRTIFANTALLTASLSGMSESTVCRSKSGFNDTYRKFKSRAERRRLAGEKISDQDKDLLRMYLDDCWGRQETVTLAKLVEWCADNWQHPLKRSALCDVLHSMGLSYKKKSANSIVEERRDLIAWRIRFLKKKLELMNPSDGIPVLVAYLDETWCYAGMVLEYTWQYKDTNPYQLARMAKMDEKRSGPQKGKSRGKRGIILSVLTKDGILDKSIEVIISGGKEDEQSEDYHKEMNAENYKKYLEKIVPELARVARMQGMRAVLIVDNAPYHNRALIKVPTKSDTKQTITNYLLSNNIFVDRSWTKPKLLEVFQQFLDSCGGRRALTVYEMDEWAMREHGVEILRTPPYHCMFNAIELLWGRLKYFLRFNGDTRDSIEDVRKRALDYLRKFPSETAKNLILHVENDEDELRRKLGIA